MRQSLLLLKLVILSLASSVCQAQNEAQSEVASTERYIQARQAEFGQCLDNLRARAARESIPAETIDTVFGTIRFLPEVIKLDRTQAEFTKTFQEYVKATITEGRVEKGRQMFAKHREYLAELTKEFGIPGQYLTAFWGLESNFGSFMGRTATFDTLATLGCDPRRSDFFSGELLMALKLLAENDLTVESFQGSWAGALGHTQFMPSNYRRYGVDGDNDGVVDLWNSERDALRSAANFLNQLGWRTGERWGREVRLPDDFDYQNAGAGSANTLANWAVLGVRRADGKALPLIELPASIIVPQGHLGPAFVVYPNFDVIMKWNRSQSYALAVGHLADRIVGAGKLSRLTATSGPRLTRQLVSDMQLQLQRLGYDPGEVDGLYGGGTKAALRAYQAQNGLIADGFPDQSTIEALLKL